MRYRRYQGTRCRQRGGGLIEALLVTLLVGSALAAGLAWLQVDSQRERLREQKRSLTEGERALESFAMMNHRLPCPDTDGDGLENRNNGDCVAPNEKGALPWQTLGVPDPAASGLTQELAYMVDDAGTDVTLTRVDADDFNYGKPGTSECLRTAEGLARYRNHDELDNSGLPLTARECVERLGTPKAEFRDGDITSAADLCRSLARTAGDGGPQLAGTDSREVAFALAHPGGRDSDGDGDLFDGPNAASNARMAELDRGAQPGYDDRVVAQGHSGLARRLGCGPLMRSLEAVSLTIAVVEEVNAQHDWVTTSAERGVRISSQRLSLVGLAPAVSAAMAVEDGMAAVRAARECPPLPPPWDPFACPALPAYGAAAISHAVSIGGLSASAALHGLALADYRAAEDQLQANTPWNRREALLDAADQAGAIQGSQPQ